MGLFRIRDFTLLFSSRNVSRMGDHFTFGALLVLVAISSKNSPVALAVISAASFAPTAFFGWAAGVYADRLDKRTAMVVADLARMVLVGLVFFAHSFVGVVVLAFLLKLMTPLYQSAYRALMPVVVGEGDVLMQANALDQTAANIVDLVGYGLGGLFIISVGVRPAFFFDSATYLVSAGLIALVRTRLIGASSGTKRRPTFLEDLTQGVRTVFRLPIPRSLLVQIGVACLPIGVFNSLVILLLPDVYHVSSKLFPYFMALQGAAMAIGGTVLTKWPNRFQKRHLINMGLAGTGVATVVVSLVSSAGLGMLFYFLLGFGNIAFLVPLRTWYQQNLPRDVRGRGMSVFSSVVNLMLFIGTLGAGPFGAALGVGSALAVAGAVFCATGFAGYFLKATRQSPSAGETVLGG